MPADKLKGPLLQWAAMLALAGGGPLASQQARPSQAFVDSIGINTHFTFQGSAYDSVRAERAVTDLGVLHIRDASPSSWQAAHFARLAPRGVRFDVIWQIEAFRLPVSSWEPSPRAFASLVGGVQNLDAYEGTNEPNPQCSHTARWVKPVQAHQAALRAYMQANGLGSLPLIAPALCWGGGAWSQFTDDAAALGSVAAASRYGNLHAYPVVPDGVPSIPEKDCTFVSNCPAYPGRGYNLASNVENPGQPVMVTETGYLSQRASPGVGIVGQERYTLRIYLENWNLGVIRTYVYELLDENGDSYGLMGDRYSAKPAYTAVRNLIALLRDPGPPFAATQLAYGLSGSLENVDRVLLEKRNGTFELILWQAVPSINAGTHEPLGIAPHLVRLTFGSAPASIVAHTFTDTGSLAPVPLTVAGRIASVPVTDVPVVLTIEPQARSDRCASKLPAIRNCSGVLEQLSYVDGTTARVGGLMRNLARKLWSRIPYGLSAFDRTP